MNRLRILITAIGSMSAACAIERLKAVGTYVVGTDIYPGEWHHETKLCDKFYRAPLATDEQAYIQFLLETCLDNDLRYIIPLTDLEIDVINRHHSQFDDAKIVLCMQASEVLELVRDKYKLHLRFAEDIMVPSVRTCKLTDLPNDFPFPCIAKPYNGRSSEGLIRHATRKQIDSIVNKDVYILQEQLNGIVHTVDVCRNDMYGTCVAIPRQELLRTQNGAGLTIQTISSEKLINMSSYIAEELGINGCVNMEFINSGGKYYLIDINPRFSAGVAFSYLAGYNMVLNHMRCYIGENIDKQIAIKEQIIIKKYEEIIN